MRLLQGLAVSSRPPRRVAARPGMQVDWQNGSNALQCESQRAMRERVQAWASDSGRGPRRASCSPINHPLALTYHPACECQTKTDRQ